MKVSIKQVKNYLNERNTRSQWSKGVNEYAFELLEILEEKGYVEIGYIGLPKELLNGAPNWKEYSWGGLSLIYNEDIAKRLATPSELKRTRNGALRPNKNEGWLDVQTRALYQAAKIIENYALDNI